MKRDQETGSVGGGYSGEAFALRVAITSAGAVSRFALGSNQRGFSPSSFF